MRARTARVHGLNHRGEGVGRIVSGPEEGLTVFLRNTVPGDLVEFDFIERKKSFVRGRTSALVEEGPGRVLPQCTVASRCGGCMWQHLDYRLQLEWKRKLIEDAFLRIARIRDCEIKPVIPSPSFLGYRNKVEVPVAAMGGRLVSGFYEPYSHKVVPSETCFVEHPLVRRVVSALVSEINECGYTAYEEKTGRGQVRHVVGRLAPGTEEVMAVLVSNVRTLQGSRPMAQRLAGRLDGLKSVVLNVNRKKTNVIFGDQETLLYGRWYIEDLLGHDDIGFMKFRISPRSFYQVNSEQAVNLYRWIIRAAGITSRDLVFDFYSGIGTITLFAARHGRFCIGVEEVRAAVMDARTNARINGVDNVEFVEGKAARVVGSLRRYGRPSVVIMDPPRGGAEREVLETAARLSPRAIVYASCNPATLARDLIVLSQMGWHPEWVQPIDMFPMTPHVECVTLMSRIKE